jgi:NADH:ubiquinone oxidoreductase subunit 6 (subunit J)
MTFTSIIFYFFMVVAGGAAIGILFSKNVMKAALLLLLCLLGIAGLYILTYAEFVAITQILIYAGGILVIIVFGIMLTSKIGEHHLRVDHGYIFSGVLVGLSLLALLTKSMWNETLGAPSNAFPSTAQSVGMNLITRFALPFEISGILLLITLVGAAVMASFTKSKKV